ncbi:hypothetical protein R80B4_00893 [Fibrobacteres bacterium R8-0-B4]
MVFTAIFDRLSPYFAGFYPSDRANTAKSTRFDPSDRAVEDGSTEGDS